MNVRERFLNQMHYRPVDRSIIWDFGFWTETIDVWHDEGMPKHVYWNRKGDEGKIHTDEWFGMDAPCISVPVNCNLRPTFESKVIEDLGDHYIVQRGDGVHQYAAKYMSSIPHPVKYLLEDRASWEEHYKPRLDPNDPERIAPRFNEMLEEMKDPNRDRPLQIFVGSLYGWIRDWMGMENVSLLVYDEPALFEEMVETVADCAVACVKKTLDAGIVPDRAHMWEDMCYNAGPLLSPEHFKQYLVPHYKRITEPLHAAGCDIISLDCDGNIEALMPMWLDAGVNTMFPIEIGTWGADPVKYRREYGKEMLLMGGFDKHVMAQSKQAITDEVKRLAPLVEEGGFIGFADHRVPPDVPYLNYVHYLKEVRKIWGKDLDLRPMLAE